MHLPKRTLQQGDCGEGSPLGLEGIRLLQDLLGGEPTPQGSTPDAYEAGMAVRRAVLGDAHDGGWWVLGLRRAHAAVSGATAMSGVRSCRVARSYR